jgi:hypothetical protein
MNKELGYFAKIEAVLLENDKKNNANKITSY